MTRVPITGQVTPADFDFVRKLVYEHSAIALDETKEYLVEARLAPLARREGLPSITELVRCLRDGETRLRDDVIAAVATNETTFFRDVHPFDALRDVVIPNVLKANGGRRLALWSAAASTGQEAYSIAMVVREHFSHVPDITILGTDLGAGVLARARTGTFSQFDVNRGIPTRLLVKYFSRHATKWQASDELRQMVTFRQLNLARSFDSVPPMDVVFLRNVLIYFDKATKIQVLDRIGEVLRPRGYLFLGGSETTHGITNSFEQVHVDAKTVCYRFDQGKAGR